MKNTVKLAANEVNVGKRICKGGPLSLESLLFTQGLEGE
jgi:hypothetical protein